MLQHGRDNIVIAIIENEHERVGQKRRDYTTQLRRKYWIMEEVSYIN